METVSELPPDCKQIEMKYLVEITFQIGKETMSKTFTGPKPRNLTKEAKGFVFDLKKGMSDLKIIDIRSQKI